jgi:hypothetical protein
MLAFGLGCGTLRGPAVDPDERVRGEHTRIVPEPLDTLWPALQRALADESMRVEHADRTRGILSTGTQHYVGRDVMKRLPQIGDLSGLRGTLQGVTELRVAYQLLLRAAGADATRLTIRSEIEAVDREPVFLGPGLFQLLPHRIPIPSRGVLERELLRRLGADIFTFEEELFLLGEPGVD